MSDFIDFNYGYPEYDDTVERSIPQFPLLSNSNMIQDNRPIFFLPPAIAPDEKFVRFSNRCLINTGDRYIVSNYGRIFDTYEDKFVPFRLSEKYDKDIGSRGVCKSHLSYYPTEYKRETKDILVHRAVLMSFNYIDGCEELEANHKNGIRTDNSLKNLEWTTKEQNIQHARENNLIDASNNNKKSILNRDEAELVCMYYKNGLNYKQISDKLNITITSIINIINGTTFKDISLKYGIESQFNYIIPEEGIRKICKLISEGVPIGEIATRTGIDKYQILEIKNRNLYFDISIDYDFSKANEGDDFIRVLPDNIVHEICRQLHNNLTPTEVAKNMNVNINTVSAIKTGKEYKNISKKYTFTRINDEVLSDNIVILICEDMMNNMTNMELVEKYNVDRITIAHIRRHETYKHITEQYNFPDARVVQRDVDRDIIVEICERLQNGETRTSIANTMGININIVNSIRSGQGYTDISKDYKFPTLTHQLTEADIRLICEMLQNNCKTGQIMKAVGVSKYTVQRIRNRKLHTDISKDYKW